MKLYLHRITQIKITHQILKVTSQGDIPNITIELQDNKGNNYEVELFPTKECTVSIDQEVLDHAATSIDG